MARSAGNSLAVLRSVLASDASLLLFIAIDLGAGRQVRLVRDTRHWTAAGAVWQRAEILAEFPAESADGGVDSVTLKLGNLAGVATPTALRGELSGRVVTMSMARSDDLSAFDPALTWVLESTTVSVDAASLVITCGQLGAGDVLPKEVYTRAQFPQLGSPT
jgi:hypothetical protein